MREPLRDVNEQERIYRIVSLAVAGVELFRHRLLFQNNWGRGWRVCDADAFGLWYAENRRWQRDQDLSDVILYPPTQPEWAEGVDRNSTFYRWCEQKLLVIDLNVLPVPVGLAPVMVRVAQEEGGVGELLQQGVVQADEPLGFCRGIMARLKAWQSPPSFFQLSDVPFRTK